MAFWHRIAKSKLKIACTQFRSLHIQLPHASSSFYSSAPKPPRPHCPFHDRPTRFFVNSVRFFAVPIQFQAKLKKEEDYGSDGPRLNEEIKSQYVRLVLDDGHSIVSRFEALERAKQLKLDLVEVQRSGKPPVCKIMDYHKETYKKQEMEKERAKSKVTLRKGECKEVRISEKTELKDLKVKADMVRKLMDKGYRVKCKAACSNEDQDMTGPLTRLLALIEDVTVVESEPRMAKKEAFMIVRHVKYGQIKKGAGKGKKLQDVKAQEGESEEEVLSDGDEHISGWTVSNNVNETTSPDHQTNAAQEPFIPSNSNDSVFPNEPENRYKRAAHPSANNAQSNTMTENRYSRRPDPRNRFQQTPFNNNTDADRRPEASNRYQQTTSNNSGDSRRPDPRNRFQQTPFNNNTDADRRPEASNRYQQTTSNNSGDSRRPDPRNRFQQPTFNNTDAARSMRHVPADVNANSRIENTKQGVTPGSRNPMPSRDLSQPRPGYGIFSAQKGPEAQGQPFSQDSQ
ncbi:hypothetical protein RIF29_23121 [Crotalaria pallida]|uniref:Translation initiation factor 3 N-terminal domain-containing protein n=1 Tax=Crotalaria pallida TaxID=3830 RepID=A0AAN9F783_CROPI